MNNSKALNIEKTALFRGEMVLTVYRIYCTRNSFGIVQYLPKLNTLFLHVSFFLLLFWQYHEGHTKNALPNLVRHLQ